MEYKHEDVPAFTMTQLIDYLNKEGQEGWVLVSHGKATKLGYASIIMMRVKGGVNR